MLRSIFLLLALVPSLALAQTPPAPCGSPEARQFDFWVGEWDLTWPKPDGTTGTGTNTISAMWGDCGVLEQFDGESGAGRLLGHSVSMYDARRGKWRQTWVDNQGSYLEFEGGLDGDSMALYGTGQPRPDGTPVITRMVFLNIQPDSFDWHWQSSSDDGATWTTNWPIHYARRDASR